MKKLDFTKKASTKWGTLMMGGVKIISSNDTQLLLKLLKDN